jgi:hypothetical protein
VQPKQRRAWATVVDGMADPRAVSADLILVGAEKYLPLAAARARRDSPAALARGAARN